MDAKERLSKRTGIKGKQLEKIKFALVVGSGGFPKAEYLEDSECCKVLFMEMVTNMYYRRCPLRKD